MSKSEKEFSPMKTGILVVGLGGNNGVTLLAGLLANKHKLEWESTAAGRVSAPNWNGCISQLPVRGGGVGFRGIGRPSCEELSLSDASNAVIGGWDIRPTPLGDALYESRVLDYDLVRQVRDEMNGMSIMKGIYDESFLGDSQHATATHIVKQAGSWVDKVNHIRSDIRSFLRNNNLDLDSHTTVIWSASVERPADIPDYQTADELLKAITSSDGSIDLSPSILYAVAAGLEGCSFINGGSQNTISNGLCDLFEATTRSSLRSSSFKEVSTRPAYMLGTDFKAGQTKFKTAAVEYIRALGLKPRVIASSNHLGNNDMKNLLTKKTLDSKMRVKSNIFGPWEENDLDHQVKVMYTEFMGDEKRDVVEYTSLGFLDSPHTMLTYTRCMDSILCVPLMIDGAVWCEYFARHGTDSSTVAKATAYLFKVPEGGAKGVDPGFHKQMQALESALQQVAITSGTASTANTASSTEEMKSILEKGVASGVISAQQAESLLALQ